MAKTKIIAPTSNWWARGACRGLDRDMFFPESDESEVEAEAIAVCRLCPVMHECRQWALSVPERFGVWGGLTERERKTLLHRRRRVHCPGCEGVDIVQDPVLTRVEICRSCGLSWEV